MESTIHISQIFPSGNMVEICGTIKSRYFQGKNQGNMYHISIIFPTYFLWNYDALHPVWESSNDSFWTIHQHSIRSLWTLAGLLLGVCGPSPGEFLWPNVIFHGFIPWITQTNFVDFPLILRCQSRPKNVYLITGCLSI